MAYEYVSEKEVKPYRSECSQMLTELRDYLNACHIQVLGGITV